MSYISLALSLSQDHLAAVPGQESQRLVMVVSGSAPMRSHLRALLNMEPGFCFVAEAETGSAALELFFRFRPDVVLVDLSLSEGNAFEVLKCLKESAPDCEVILLSNLTDPLVGTLAGRLRATHICYKGDGLARVREALRSLL